MYLEHRSTLEELIQGCRNENSRCQEALFTLFSAKMFTVCLRYARDQMEAEDILQAGFIKMFDKIKEFKAEGSFEGWLRRIIINTGLEYIRKRDKSLVFQEVLDDMFTKSPDISLFETEYLMVLIQNLTPGYRIVFNLYAIDGYSHKEIGLMLKISEGTSKSQLARARFILREKLLEAQNRKDYGRR